MLRRFLLVGVLACVLAAFLQAQTQFNPKPPFTTKDVDLWITLSKSSAKSCRWMFT